MFTYFELATRCTLATVIAFAMASIPFGLLLIIPGYIAAVSGAIFARRAILHQPEKKWLALMMLVFNLLVILGPLILMLAMVGVVRFLH